jgi:hypothetical protein
VNEVWINLIGRDRVRRPSVLPNKPGTPITNDATSKLSNSKLSGISTMFLIPILERCLMTIHREEFAAFVKFGSRDIPPHPDISRRMLRRLAQVDDSDMPAPKTVASHAAPASSTVLQTMSHPDARPS